ncbi:MAG: pyridoxamine 5'-phosphate oxidase family protein [Oscillospiraceae bacterium]|nr:pyridoxamine 5'-phosphate oxidase family protein [Oscillospiraceae bacterium]
MEKLSKDTERIMNERFGGDSIISLATAVDNIPYVRNVDAFYLDGSFYVLTYGLSSKMVQIEKNSIVAVSGEWFTAHGKGINLGYFAKPENEFIADKMKTVFSRWIDNGHNNFDDENTCILRIELTDGVLFSNGKCYEIDFSAK